MLTKKEYTYVYEDSRLTRHVEYDITLNIIWYWHKSGAHYVALQWNGKKFIGYNTYTNSTGPDDWGNSISATLNSKGWTATLLISISNK